MVSPGITRPALRWYGGKFLLAPKLIDLFPPHRVYVEPFGGAASVLLRKGRSYAEIYNDLDDEIVNLFRVLRNSELAERLVSLLRLTPFARTEWRDAYVDTDDPVERAMRLIIISFMGFGANAQSRYSTGFRSNSNRSGTTPAQDWVNYPDALEYIIDRLRGVIIENRDAGEVMLRHDSPETLHYVDPPYVMATRWNGDPTGRERRGYRHELTDQDHIDLVNLLRGLRGGVVLSGYRHEIYDSLLSDWLAVEFKAFADGARERIEVVWLNPKAAAGQRQANLLHRLDEV